MSATSAAGRRGLLPVTLLLLVVTLMAATACRSDPAPPSPTAPTQQRADWPERLADFRFRWTAEPGIALDTGWAVPLRAYLESWKVIFYTEDMGAGYPGYLRATPELLEKWDAEWLNTPLAQREIRGFRGDRNFPDPSARIVGNEDLRVIRVEPMATGFRAFVCDATFGVYTQSPGTQQVSPLNLSSSQNTSTPDFHNMKVWRIEFSDKDSRVGTAPPAAPMTPQQGPLPAPRDDVFGPWFVTGASDVAAWSDSDFPELTPGSPEDLERSREARRVENDMRQQCLDSYPVNAADRTKQATTVLDSPPAVQPAQPGWPEAK